jgi:hypothetical protein
MSDQAVPGGPPDPPTRLSPLEPEMRDAIARRLRLCRILRTLKRQARTFHNQAPETFNRLHAQHRGLQEQFVRIRRVRPIARAARERDGFCLLLPRWWPAEDTAWGRKPWVDPDRPQP